jgi:hypothetical protein
MNAKDIGATLKALRQRVAGAAICGVEAFHLAYFAGLARRRDHRSRHLIRGDDKKGIFEARHFVLDESCQTLGVSKTKACNSKSKRDNSPRPGRLY